MTVAAVILSRAENLPYLQRAVESAGCVTDQIVVGVPDGHSDQLQHRIVVPAGVNITYTDGFGIRGAAGFVEHVAREYGWAFWLADNEVVMGPAAGWIRLDAIATEAVADGKPSPLMIQSRAPNLSVVGLIRMIPSGFRFPAWTRQSLQMAAPNGPCLGTQAVGVGCGPTISIPDDLIRFNIGAGPRLFPRWISVDHDPSNRPDVFWKVGGPMPMPFQSGMADAIYCSHMIDHLDWEAGRRFLTDCTRILKPAAPIRITACDLRVFASKYIDGTIGDLAYFQPPEFTKARTAGSKFGIVACGAFSDRSWYTGHRQLFDGPALCEALEDTGFCDVTECEENEIYDTVFEDVDDIFPDHTVYVCGRRPG